MAGYATPEEEWSALLTGTHPHLSHPSPLRFVPSSPRCKLCKAPFRGPGGAIFGRYGFAPWPKNPNICGRCFRAMETATRACPRSQDGSIAGAEIELSMLFADVRGSSKIARTMSSVEFTRLMNRFYRVSSDVLFGMNAIVEKFVGDEVVGLFIPMLTGPEHARVAVETAQALLHATGHGTADGPWVPLGAAVHTGRAFVGIVSSGANSDFTALGDPLNEAAHLASHAAAGEVLVTVAAASSGGIDTTGAERRDLSLKGHPMDAIVLGVSDAAAAS
ncbi:MAG TPA: adenylate/guanylate cyclase domain-containing protein [Actinomycetota bacterium]|jgi:adenylate cyclase|nr:adenylate/guanylate cyclase domain-containing protein [Actinomycetota bacterium]